jgi:hypothetical protein
MGDEMNPDQERTTTREKSSTASRKIAAFWRMMLDLFGQRWVTNYGQEPSPLWTSAIETLTAKEIKAGIRQLLTRGAAHPPTLPEFIDAATADSSKKPSRFPQPFSPLWNEQRKELLAKIAAQSKARGVEFTAEQRKDSIAAVTMAERSPDDPGYAEAQSIFEANARLARLLAENRSLPMNADGVIIAPQYVPQRDSAYLEDWRKYVRSTAEANWPIWLRADPVARSLLAAR